MKPSTFAAIAATATLLSTAAQATVVTVSYEAPGAQNTTASLALAGVETFDGRSGDFTTDFGTGGQVSGTYTGASVIAADQYGGAGGTGSYPTTFSSYELKLSGVQPINYFGFWLSAIDGGNGISFFNGDTELFHATGDDFTNALAGDWHYKGNPTEPFEGADYGEKFAFVNFTSDTPFDRVLFSARGGGLETDNHTVGFAPAALAAVRDVAAIPEPASWTLMIIGFGGVGATLRTSRRHAHRQGAAQA